MEVLEKGLNNVIEKPALYLQNWFPKIAFIQKINK